MAKITKPLLPNVGPKIAQAGSKKALGKPLGARKPAAAVKGVAPSPRKVF